MNNNFTDISTKLKDIRKSINGYNIYRNNSNNKYIINLILINNKIKFKAFNGLFIIR